MGPFNTMKPGSHSSCSHPKQAGANFKHHFPQAVTVLGKRCCRSLRFPAPAGPPQLAAIMELAGGNGGQGVITQIFLGSASK